ncbi:unnamed protein product [Rotaria socialis]|uniref:Uncharacterized protein n=1 Tax=Rotaria socialis TaxID=392032 RepID=A0A819X7R3_9BILA|nr:unnamed protein product [Rotaria socialis]
MRLDGYYNTAPTSAIVPVRLLRQDGDTVKCRWASATVTVPNGVVADKCVGICNTFPRATLITDNCTMSYTASAVGFWAVSLMMEDYEFTWKKNFLSATFLQFLVQVYTSSSTCIVGPAYTGNRPVGACVGCTGVTLLDVLTASPPGMTRDVITQLTTSALVYSITMTWIPPAYVWIAYGNLTGQTTASTTIVSIPTVSTLGASTTAANANITTTGITVPSSSTLYTGIGTSSTIRTTTTSTISTLTSTYPSVQIVNPSGIIQRCK